MSRRWCHQQWGGPCPPGVPAAMVGTDAAATHFCARPPSHPVPCRCYCGTRKAEPAARDPRPVEVSGQEPLFTP